jgi:hypothetical protein
MKSKKTGIETVAAAFTDHFAVVLRIAIGCTNSVTRKRLLENEHIPLERRYLQTRNTDTLEKWQTYKKYYPNTVM